ncbi:MAG: hypothetical protein KDD55_10640, partial [Bdellovibrionales bacterium]|nr:hypothetical protein [Bdellovibrionales bacterium]
VYLATMKRILLATSLLVLCHCSTRDYYMNMANSTTIQEKRRPYLEAIKAIDEKSEYSVNHPRKIAYPLGMGSFMVSYGRNG